MVRVFLLGVHGISFDLNLTQVSLQFSPSL